MSSTSKFQITEIQEIISNSTSYAECLRKMNIKPSGGNYYTLKKKISTFNIDTSHFKGLNWSINKQLKDWTNYKISSGLKKHLIKHAGHICDRCKNTHWQNALIPLEVHHIDGDRKNNALENLQLLCPNCHALTENYRGRKQGCKTNKKNNDKIPEYSPKENIKTKICWPDKKELELLIANNSMRTISKILGVSERSIRKRAIKYNIDIRSLSPWSKRHRP